MTYVVNRNINFTNVCYVGCRFCAFAQRRTDADAYSLSLDQVADRAEEAWGLGATEVCMQGGIDPELPGTAYFDLAAAVKTRVPGMHVHAFSPMEIVNGSSRTGLSFEDFLIKARESGLDTIPGTAAEILDDDVRWVLTKGKLPTSTWVEIVSTAHRVGVRSSSTMMYGHVDNPRHWVNHLRVLSRIQDETGGFTEFVPLPFVHHSAPIYLAGVARPGPTLRDNLAVHAMARILLHGRIPNIQTSWVKLGTEGTRAMLAGRRQRPRRHPDGGDHLPDGRFRARLGQDGRGAGRDRLRHRASGGPARDDVRAHRRTGLTNRPHDQPDEADGGSGSAAPARLRGRRRESMPTSGELKYLYAWADSSSVHVEASGRSTTPDRVQVRRGRGPGPDRRRLPGAALLRGRDRHRTTATATAEVRRALDPIRLDTDQSPHRPDEAAAWHA